MKEEKRRAGRKEGEGEEGLERLSDGSTLNIYLRAGCTGK